MNLKHGFLALGLLLGAPVCAFAQMTQVLPVTLTVTIVPLSSADTGNAASFTVGGAKGATYAITLPSSLTLTATVGGYTMTVDTFTSSPSGTGLLSATTGQQALAVGATVHVGASQSPGTYNGTFSLTVAYN